jgi:hypothetical protein
MEEAGQGGAEVSVRVGEAGIFPVELGEGLGRVGDLPQGLCQGHGRGDEVEGGGMRTDWAGSSMEIPSFQDAYRLTVSAMAERLRRPTAARSPSTPPRPPAP